MKKETKMIIVVSAVLLMTLIIASIVGIIVSNSSTTSTDLLSNESIAHSDLPAQTITEAITNPPTEQPTAKKKYKLGETYDNNGVKITFVSFEPYKSELDENKSKSMLNVHFKLENNSNEDITFSVLDFSCYVNNKTTEIPIEFNDDHIQGFEKVPVGRYTERGIVIEASKNDNVEIDYGGQTFVIIE